MKIQFVESFDINESNEYRKYLGQRKLQMSNPKGNLQSLPTESPDGNLRELATNALNYLAIKHPGIKFVIHHINSKHERNRLNNLALVPEKYHNGLFSRAVEQFEKEDRLKSDYKDLKYAKHLIASIEEINNKINKLNKKFNKKFRTLPIPSDDLISKVYANRENDVINFAEICADIFDVDCNMSGNPYKVFNLADLKNKIV